LSEKRETDLINLRIIEKNEKIFPEETAVLRASTNFMRRLTGISGKALPNFDEQPSLRAVIGTFLPKQRTNAFFHSLHG
jgi:hypothetical protein